MPNISVRDMDRSTEYFVGTCSHTDESEEIDRCAVERIKYLKAKMETGFKIKVGLLDDSPAGFIYLVPIEHSPWGPLGKNLIFIPCLYVIKRGTGFGLGQVMMAAAEDEAHRSGRSGLATIGYYNDLWFMPATFFERSGYIVAAHSGSEALLWKRLEDLAVPPRPLKRNYQKVPSANAVVIDLFWNQFCETSAIEAERVRQVAACYGERVVLNEYDNDNRDVLLRFQLPRGIFIDGQEISWGYEAPREGIAEAIEKALEQKKRPDFEIRPIRVEQYEDCMRLMLAQAGLYLERTMELMQMDRRQFGELFRNVGKVFMIYTQDKPAGFYWIEERGPVLHIHGLIIKKEFQGKGFGTRILRALEKEYTGKLTTIEMGVHASNNRALALYRRLGYRAVKVLDYLDFIIMQKDLKAGAKS